MNQNSRRFFEHVGAEAAFESQTGTELNGTVRRDAGFVCSVCAGKFHQSMTFDANQVSTDICYQDCNRVSLRYFVGPLKNRLNEAKMLTDDHFSDDDINIFGDNDFDDDDEDFANLD